MTEGLTDREREILADGFQPHILRYDLEEKRPCDHVLCPAHVADFLDLEVSR